MSFSRQLRNAYEGKYRSVTALQAAIVAIYGDQAISRTTIRRFLSAAGYAPRTRRPFIQLKRVLPELETPQTGST